MTTTKEKNQLMRVDKVAATRKEGQPIRLGMNVGVTTDDVELSINASKKDIFGFGDSAASVSYSKSLGGGHRFNVSAIKPLEWVKNGSRYAAMAGLTCYQGLTNMQWNCADVEEKALVLDYKRTTPGRWLSHFRLSAALRNFVPGPQAIDIVKEQAGQTVKLSVENALTLADTRNNPIFPSSGGLIRVSQELAGLFAADRKATAYFKHRLDMQASFQLPLGFFTSASFRAAALSSSERLCCLPVLDRVYLGGPFDVRGFDMNSIGMRVNGSSLGGSLAYAYALHLYRPLPFSNRLLAHGFVSAGSVTSVRPKEWMNDLSNSARVSAGAGVTFALSDTVRFELNYVHPLRQMPGDACKPGIQFGAGVDFL